MANKDMHEFYVQLRRPTQAALLVFDGQKEVWLPRSQIEYSPTNKEGELCVWVPEWMAISKGLY